MGHLLFFFGFKTCLSFWEAKRASNSCVNRVTRSQNSVLYFAKENPTSDFNAQSLTWRRGKAQHSESKCFDEVQYDLEAAGMVQRTDRQPIHHMPCLLSWASSLGLVFTFGLHQPLQRNWWSEGNTHKLTTIVIEFVWIWDGIWLWATGLSWQFYRIRDYAPHGIHIEKPMEWAGHYSCLLAHK